jgi:hypothetical protein
MINQLGLVVQTDGDAGDCPCRTGVYLAYQYDSGKMGFDFVSAIQKNLQVAPAIYVRDSVKWNDPKDFSRDQASRLMLGFFYAGQSPLAWQYYKLAFKNWLRHQNGDIIGFTEWSNIIRGFDFWFLYPLLWFFDLGFIFGVTLGVKLKPWDSDNLQIADLFFAQKKFNTLPAFIASLIYDKAAAKIRVQNNLSNANGNNGCLEALIANLYFLDRLP